ncbi:MAG: hypothetical protein RR619_07995, partial [Raoultibacter sp.]
ALGALFNLVRRQSTDGQLVTPADWESFDVVPSHMDAEAFEMFTYDYLEEQKALREDASKPEETLPTYKTATRAVGVPRMFEKAETETGKPSSADDLGSEDSATLSTEVDEIPDDNQDFMQEDLGFDIPEGFELVELEGELTLVPIEDDVESDALACDDISMLMGKQSYYLYSNTVMTDAYAHWAFLAREDDRIVTFVDCVRSESRTYPRPMAASGLKNDPFNMSDEDIEQTWSALRESGEYPDIETTVASNGEVFYYSTEHLSPSYAASLAEWHAVERAMYL